MTMMMLHFCNGNDCPSNIAVVAEMDDTRLYRIVCSLICWKLYTQKTGMQTALSVYNGNVSS